MAYELCDAPRLPQSRIDDAPTPSPQRRELGALPYERSAAALRPPAIVTQQSRADGSVLTKYSDGHTEVAQPDGRGMSLPAPSPRAAVPQPCLDPKAQAESLRRFRAAQSPNAPDVVADLEVRQRRQAKGLAQMEHDRLSDLRWRQMRSGAVESDPIQPLDLLIPGKLAYGLYQGGTQGLLHVAKDVAVEKGADLLLEHGAEALKGGHHGR